MKKKNLILVAANMLADGVPDATIRFFLSVYPYVVETKTFNCSDLSNQSDHTSESARQHVTVLTDFGFLDRIGYRSWSLNASKFRSLGDLKIGQETL